LFGGWLFVKTILWDDHGSLTASITHGSGPALLLSLSRSALYLLQPGKRFGSKLPIKVEVDKKHPGASGKATQSL
jgi:hypothetical protein